MVVSAAWRLLFGAGDSLVLSMGHVYGHFVSVWCLVLGVCCLVSMVGVGVWCWWVASALGAWCD